MEVVGSDRNEVIWEVVDDKVIKKENDHEKIGLWGFGFNFFMKMRRGLVEKGLVSILIY